MSAINIGSRRELFVDKLMIDSMENTSLKLHEPVPVDTSIKIDKPWEGGVNSGYGVVKADDGYHLYYRAMHVDMGSDPELNFCVAISKDGVEWSKPVLQPEGTNFVDFAQCFLDTRPGVPRSERFKAFRSEAVDGEQHTPNHAPSGAMKLTFFASEDGFRFYKMDPQPVLVSQLPNSFDGGCTMFWSEAEQQYVFYYRYSIKLSVGKNDPPLEWHRSVARMTSKDFYTWSEPERMRFKEVNEQIYVNNTAPYFRAPHIYLGAAARFMERSYALNQEQIETILFENGDNPEHRDHFSRDCSDGVLLTTRAGTVGYDRTFMESFIRPGIGCGNWVSRTNYPLSGIVPYDEATMFLYVSRGYWQNTWHIERLALRTDGFASLNAPWSGGTATTKLFVFEGSELEINYRTGAAGYVRIELLDEDGYVVPGFQADMCERMTGNEIKRIVRWRSDVHPDYALANYAGTPVRLRFHLKDADIFSFKFN